MKLKPLTSQTMVYLGCDPEFFFEREGKIIGSEHVIDINAGLAITTYDDTKTGSTGSGASKFVVDGVQAELNPRPDTCRERLANEVSYCFRELYKKVKDDKTLKVNFKPTVELTTEELDKLNEKSKVFGCAPSKNAGAKRGSKIKVDASKYMYRSAGGHIHLGKYLYMQYQLAPDGQVNYSAPMIETPQKAFDNPTRLVNMLDILVGNTCVLIDRDEGNKIRRKVYGKAGEYRTPEHGVEYRTLSNFWLRSYPLMAFVMGMSRIAVSLLNKSTDDNDYEAELLKLVKMADIRRAINKNDFELAYSNFQKIKDFIAKVIPTTSVNYSNTLNAYNLDAFEHFVAKVKEKGIEYWFPIDAMTHWVNLPRASGIGFEMFLEKQVRADMAKTKVAPVLMTTPS